MFYYCSASGHVTAVGYYEGKTKCFFQATEIMIELTVCVFTASDRNTYKLVTIKCGLFPHPLRKGEVLKSIPDSRRWSF